MRPTYLSFDTDGRWPIPRLSHHVHFPPLTLRIAPSRLHSTTSDPAHTTLCTPQLARRHLQRNKGTLVSPTLTPTRPQHHGVGSTPTPNPSSRTLTGPARRTSIIFSDVLPSKPPTAYAASLKAARPSPDLCTRHANQVDAISSQAVPCIQQKKTREKEG